MEEQSRSKRDKKIQADYKLHALTLSDSPANRQIKFAECQAEIPDFDTQFQFCMEAAFGIANLSTFF